MTIIKFAILTMIGTVISSIVLMGSELDAAALQNHTSITSGTSSNIQEGVRRILQSMGVSARG